MRVIYDKNHTELAMTLTKKDYAQAKLKTFYTDGNDTLQVGSLFFGEGSNVPAHTHKSRETPHNPMEIIIVVRGLVEAEVYDAEGELAYQFVMGKNDMLIQKHGGHGFKFMKNTTLLEIKNGPYQGREYDKVLI